MPPSRTSRSFFFSALVLACGLAFAALILANPLRAYVKSRQFITVKGYAERPTQADFAVWSATITTRAKLVTDAAAAMDKDSRTAADFLHGQGVDAAALHLSDLTTTALSKSSQGGDGVADLDGYKLDREMTVASSDVEAISRLSGTGPQLLRQGLEVSFHPAEYYCTKLADIKVAMLGEAVQDARRRAEEIAAKSNRKIGALRSANQGIFQITAVYQSETSDEGTLDTSSRQKSIKAVVTAEFELE